MDTNQGFFSTTHQPVAQNKNEQSKLTSDMDRFLSKIDYIYRFEPSFSVLLSTAILLLMLLRAGRSLLCSGSSKKRFNKIAKMILQIHIGIMAQLGIIVFAIISSRCSAISSIVYVCTVLGISATPFCWVHIIYAKYWWTGICTKYRAYEILPRNRAALEDSTLDTTELFSNVKETMSSIAHHVMIYWIQMDWSTNPNSNTEAIALPTARRTIHDPPNILLHLLHSDSVHLEWPDRIPSPSFRNKPARTPIMNWGSLCPHSQVQERHLWGAMWIVIETWKHTATGHKYAANQKALGPKELEKSTV